MNVKDLREIVGYGNDLQLTIRFGLKAGDQHAVIVAPLVKKEPSDEEEAVLSMPLLVAGTEDELDAPEGLVGQIRRYARKRNQVVEARKRLEPLDAATAKATKVKATKVEAKDQGETEPASNEEATSETPAPEAAPKAASGSLF